MRKRIVALFFILTLNFLPVIAKCNSDECSEENFCKKQDIECTKSFNADKQVKSNRINLQTSDFVWLGSTSPKGGDDLVLLNKKNGKYHKPSCEYALKASNVKLIKKPIIKYSPSTCCYSKNHIEKYNNKHYIFNNPNFQSDNLKVYYLDGFKYKKPSTNARSTISKILIREIQNAQKSINFAIYGIAKQPDIEKALLNAKKRGIDVLGVVDMTQENKNIYSDTEHFIDKIQTIHNDYEIADKNVRDDFNNIFDITAAIMHNKFFVFDNRKVFTGSTNISNSGTGGYNTNVSLLIDSLEIAELYTQEFEQMYNLKFHTIKNELTNNKNIQIDKDTKISVFFAPKNKVFTTELHEILSNAQKSIYIEMFYLTNKSLIKDIIRAKNRGVDVKIILDASSAINEYSGHKQLRSAGIPVKIENWGGKMHTKTAIIDDEYYIIGSMNWTGKAELHNDENILIIENYKLVKNAKHHFYKIWNIIPDKYLTEIPKAEGKDSKYSCNDGLDNDHDGKIDFQDEDCIRH